jgi:CHAT domain-containing protein/Flp pilus assembly protein TadD
VFAYLYLARSSKLERGNQALIEAFSERRVIEQRLSGGFKAGLFSPSGDNASGIKTEKMEEARILLSAEAARNEDPRAQLAWGRMMLLDKQVRSALSAFKVAVELMPQSAEARNDLGVYFMQRDKYAEAVEVFDEALNIDPNMREALFNRGLCYSRLYLRTAAQTDWDRAAEVETDPGWLEEINRQREDLALSLRVNISESEEEKKERIRKSLIDEIAKNNLDAARAIVSENFEIALNSYKPLLLNYLESSVKGRQEEAEKTLASIRTLAGLLKERDDWMVADLAEYLSNLREDRRESELKLIKDFDTNYKLIGNPDSRGQKAFEEMSKLYLLFKERGNYVFQQRAASQMAHYLYNKTQFDPCRRIALESRALLAQRKWPLEMGCTYWTMSIAYHGLGLYPLAIQYGEKALEIHKGLGLKDREAKAQQAISFIYGGLGATDLALLTLRESLDATMASTPRPTEVVYDLLEIANFYRQQGNKRLPLLYAEEAYTSAKHALNAAEIAAQERASKSQRESSDLNDTIGQLKRRLPQSLSFKAVELAQMNRKQEAEECLKRSFELLKSLKDDEHIDTIQNVFSRAAEMAEKSGDYKRAIDYYSEAKDKVSNSQATKLPLINILNARARVYGKMNETAKGREDLAEAVRLIEKHREKIAGSKLRSEFLATSQSVIDQLISLDVKAGRGREAYDLSERYRGRAMTEQMAQRPARLDEVQAGLPDNLILAQYSVTDQGTYIFVTTRSGFEYVISQVTAESLDRLVNDYLSDLKEKADIEQINSKGSELYQHLIAPIEKYLAPDARLCIVPDKRLHFLPFAALLDNSNRYFIESFNPTYAPSSTVLLQCIKADREKSGRGEESFFAVGNPEFDQEEFKTLSPLLDAEREVNQSALFYSNSSRVVLIGPDATERRVRENMINSEVIHLALHSIVDESASWLVALILAKDQSGTARAEQIANISNTIPNTSPIDSSPGKLCFNEVGSLGLSNTRLVILSSCQSGIGQYYRGEGIVSIVRPFIAAKVPMVVASLWPVDSEPTSDLMIEFHRQRKQKNLPTGDALRAAQLHLVNQKKPPYHWAPFIAVGSNN